MEESHKNAEPEIVPEPRNSEIEAEESSTPSKENTESSESEPKEETEVGVIFSLNRNPQ